MYIFDITEPIKLISLVVVAVLLIWLGKEIKKPVAPAIALGLFLALIVMHSIQFATIPEVNYNEIRTTLISCIGMDSIMIFITFFGYLWVDDIACKFYKKKSVDNSLDWFWKQV